MFRLGQHVTFRLQILLLGMILTLRSGACDGDQNVPWGSVVVDEAKQTACFDGLAATFSLSTNP